MSLLLRSTRICFLTRFIIVCPSVRLSQIFIIKVQIVSLNRSSWNVAKVTRFRLDGCCTELKILSVYIKHDSHHLHDKHRNPLYIVHIAFDAMLNPYFQRNRSEPQQKTKSVGRSSCIGTNPYIFMYSSQEGFLHLFWVGVCVCFFHLSINERWILMSGKEMVYLSLGFYGCL